MLDTNHQLEIIKRGVVELISEEELVKKLERGKPLRIKAGYDPTAPDLHLGHTVSMQKLRQFQDLGHTVIFLIGDFTAQVGDPSGQNKARKRLTPKEVKEFSKTYLKQAFKILDKRRTEVRYNSEWFRKFTAVDFLELTSKYTVARMLERDDFQNRYKNGDDISVMEFIYPFLQGYDSVALKADVEIGGTDQKFNLIAARAIQRRYGVEEQVVLTLPLLEGTDGVQKMSKSYGNYIGISEPAKEIFGKIMSVSDNLMWRYYELLSTMTLQEIEELRGKVERGIEHPKKVKEKLALELTARYHDDKKAMRAAREFEIVFAKKGMPNDIETAKVASGTLIFKFAAESGMVSSGGECKRLIGQGGVKIDDKKVEDPQATLPNGEHILQIGKRKFKKVIVG